MRMAEIDPERWVSELRKRLHDQGNAQMRLEGEMLADRRVAEERHRQAQSQNQEIKADLSNLSGLVTGQGNTMSGIQQDVRSVLQRMDADEQARLKTAAALQAADDARRQADAAPWVTPNRVLGFLATAAAVLAFIASQLN